MGSGFLSSPSDQKRSAYSEVFDTLCPYYLSIGMSYELYWCGDPVAARHFRKADSLRKKRKNAESWWQGLYIYEAIGDMAPVLRPFAKSGTKPLEYPSEPYPIDEEEYAEKQKREEEAKKEETRLMLKSWAMSVNQKLQEGGEGRWRTNRSNGST